MKSTRSNRESLLLMSLLLVTLVAVLPGILQAQDKTVPQLGKNSLKEVIAAMTVQEKINLVIGTGMKMQGLPAALQGPVVGLTEDKVAGAAGTTIAIPRLGIPSIVVADGPAGVRIKPIRDSLSGVTYYCTAFPIGTLLASSWDTALVSRVGKAMGNEVKEYGIDILLGPALNNQRNPLGGRNFEYYSEDPLISGWIAAAYIKGVQSNGVGTSIKHFALNNNEWNRNIINVIAGERAIREIYLRGFQLAIRESRPWTVMSSYNHINGIYASESRELLTGILRDEWKYNGFVMTDWYGGRDAVAQMKAGNDLLMPGTAIQQTALTDAMRNKTLDESVLDLNVERILKIILISPAFKKYAFSNKPDLKAHAAIARSAASEGMILLKNDGNALPLTNKNTRLAAFGQTSYGMITGGTGSGDVNEAYTVSLIDGLTAAGYGVDQAASGVYATYLREALQKRPKRANPFLLPPPIPEMEMTASMAKEIADRTDCAIITIGRNSGEFADRHIDNDFLLSPVEKKLIETVSTVYHAQQKKVILILNIGGVIETRSWSAFPDAILLSWQPGQEAGNAIADILGGMVTPSGKLAVTFPVDYMDVPSSEGFPGKVLEGKDPNDQNPFAGDKAAEITYKEGIYTGYRHFDKAGVAPAYEFGYGLSYTQFGLSALKINGSAASGSLTATFTVTNTGKVAGKEVVQCYVAAPGKTLDKPAQELKAFAKTNLLQPGQSQTIRFAINAAMLSSFDPGTSSWIAEAGAYTIRIGTSSRKLSLSAGFTVAKPVTTETVKRLLIPAGGFEPAARQ